MIFQGFRGGPHFPGGVQLFPGGEGGPNTNFYRNPYTCDFPGGGGEGSGPPILPLDPHMYINSFLLLVVTYVFC